MLHEAMIGALVDQFPEIQTGNFWSAIRCLPDADYTQDLLASSKKWANSIKFIPDAFAVHQELREIVVFEVVVSHDISDDKFERMVDLAFALDEDDYSLALLRCDQFGTTAYPLMETWVRCHLKGGIQHWKLHSHTPDPAPEITRLSAHPVGGMLS